MDADAHDVEALGHGVKGRLAYEHRCSGRSILGGALSVCPAAHGRAVKQDFFSKKVLEDVEKVLKRFTSSQSRIKLQTRLI